MKSCGRVEIEARANEVVRLVARVFRDGYARFGFLEMEDAIAEGVLNVYRRADLFDPCKSSFANFVCIVARSGISMYLRRELKREERRADIDGLEEVIGYEPEVYAVDDYNFSRVMEVAEEWRGTKRKIIDMVAQGVAQKDIARELGVTKQYVSRTFQRFKERCNERFEFEDGVVEEKEMIL